MRREPTWRIPAGVLGLVLALAIYGIAIANIVPPLIGTWPALAQTPVYIVLGTIWLLPLRRFLIWMETGRWG
jgi:membrane protein YdbS with pleckstrin-like domain